MSVKVTRTSTVAYQALSILAHDDEVDVRLVFRVGSHLGSYED